MFWLTLLRGFTEFGHRKPYIRQFAAESFAYLLRKLSEKKLKKEMLGLLKAMGSFGSDGKMASRPEGLKDGTARLLFECVRGIGGGLTSVAPQLLQALFQAAHPKLSQDEDSLALARFPPRLEVLCRMIFLVAKHCKANGTPIVLDLVHAEVAALHQELPQTKKSSRGTLNYHLAAFLQLLSGWVRYGYRSFDKKEPKRLEKSLKGIVTSTEWQSGMLDSRVKAATLQLLVAYAYYGEISGASSGKGTTAVPSLLAAGLTGAVSKGASKGLTVPIPTLLGFAKAVLWDSAAIASQATGPWRLVSENLVITLTDQATADKKATTVSWFLATLAFPPSTLQGSASSALWSAGGFSLLAKVAMEAKGKAGQAWDHLISHLSSRLSDAVPSNAKGVKYDQLLHIGKSAWPLLLASMSVEPDFRARKLASSWVPSFLRLCRLCDEAGQGSSIDSASKKLMLHLRNSCLTAISRLSLSMKPSAGASSGADGAADSDSEEEKESSEDEEARKPPLEELGLSATALVQLIQRTVAWMETPEADAGPKEHFSALRSSLCHSTVAALREAAVLGKHTFR